MTDLFTGLKQQPLLSGCSKMLTHQWPKEEEPLSKAASDLTSGMQTAAPDRLSEECLENHFLFASQD